MFAPTGYTSLAELWDQFVHLRHREVYLHACETYLTPEFKGTHAYGVPNELGSPKDFLEEVFIETVRSRGVFLCSAEGSVLSLMSSVVDGSSDIFQRSLVFESTITVDELSSTGEGRDWLQSMGSREFVPWPHKLGDADLWADAYPKPENAEKFSFLWKVCRYHRLPMWFERHRFVISRAIPPWTSDAVDVAFANSTVPQLLGTSICLENRAAKKWIAENIRSEAYREFMGELPCEPDKTGRPSKISTALIYIDQLYPDGSYPSWKERCKALRTEFDFSVSEKTLRRALNERRQSGQKKGKG